MKLSSLGFTSHFLESFDRLEEPGLLPARVVRVDGDHVQVRTAEARLAVPNRAPVVTGDWVALDGEGRAIRSVLPRRTQFVRQAAGRRTEPQVVAANVDVVFLLTGLDDDFSLRRIERYLTLAHASGAMPVVLLTKAGLRSEDDRAACVAAAREVAGSMPVHAIDVLDGIEAGVPYAYVKEETTVAVSDRPASVSRRS